MSDGTWIKVTDWWEGFARRKRLSLSCTQAARRFDFLPIHMTEKINMAALVERLHEELPKAFPREIPQGTLIFGMRFMPACWGWEINVVHPSFEPVPDGNEAPWVELTWEA